MSGKLRTLASIMHFFFLFFVLLRKRNYTQYNLITRLLLSPLLLVTRCLANVEPQPVAVQVDLVGALLQNLGNVARVLEFSQIDICPALLDSVTDEFCRAGFSLCADDGGLLLLAGFVDDEGGALGFLLGDLLGFDGGGEFGGEGEVLGLR